MAQYRGKGILSKIVKFFTDSEYSHTAAFFPDGACFVIGDRTYVIPPRSVVEAWAGGCHIADYSEYHHSGVQVDLFSLKDGLTVEQEVRLGEFLVKSVGKKYDYLNVLRYIPFVRLLIPTPMGTYYTRTHVYCSELVLEAFASVRATLFERRPFWKIPPGLASTSPLLKFEDTLTTT